MDSGFSGVSGEILSQIIPNVCVLGFKHVPKIRVLELIQCNRVEMWDPLEDSWSLRAVSSGMD